MAGLEASETFAILAELGAVLLLFEVGLESTPRDMMAVGVPATVVALVGVLAPMVLGYGVDRLFHPGGPWMAHAFVGAMLAATSVGITARVLQEAKASRTPSSRIILGAAVIDDVLGLVVLAIISGVIQAATEGTTLEPAGIVVIVGKALAFLVGAIVVGSFLSPRIFRARPRPALERRRPRPRARLLLRPRVARPARRPRPDRGCVRGRPRARGRPLRRPREAGRDAAAREPPRRSPRSSSRCSSCAWGCSSTSRTSRSPASSASPSCSRSPRCSASGRAASSCRGASPA